MTKTLDLLTPDGNIPTDEDFETIDLPEFKAAFGEVDMIGVALLSVAEALRQTTIVTNLETATIHIAFSLESLFELGWRMGVVNEQDNSGDAGSK